MRNIFLMVLGLFFFAACQEESPLQVQNSIQPAPKAEELAVPVEPILEEDEDLVEEPPAVAPASGVGQTLKTLAKWAGGILGVSLAGTLVGSNVAYRYGPEKAKKAIENSPLKHVVLKPKKPWVNDDHLNASDDLDFHDTFTNNNQDLSTGFYNNSDNIVINGGDSPFVGDSSSESDELIPYMPPKEIPEQAERALEALYNAKNCKQEGDVGVNIKTLAGEEIRISNLDLSVPVGCLKYFIKEKEKISMRQQRLIFAGKYPEDNLSLGDYNIEKDATIHLVLRR